MQITLTLPETLRYPCLVLADSQQLASSDSVAIPLYGLDGNRVYAGGGGITQVGGTYYWFGMDFSHGSCRFQQIACYASTNLIDWSLQSYVLTRRTSGLECAEWIGRPHVIAHFNAQQQVDYYVMYVEFVEHGRNKVGVATCEEIAGPYTWRGDSLAFGTYTTGDHTLYRDSDGRGYFVYVEDDLLDESEDGGCNRKLVVARLADDYLSLSERISERRYRPGNKQEAPAVLKRNGVYYIFTSGTHGWHSSATSYSAAPTMAGPWSDFTLLATYPATNSSYDTQITDIVQVNTEQGEVYLYLGDKWNDPHFEDMRYAWLPLLFDERERTLWCSGFSL